MIWIAIQAATTATVHKQVIQNFQGSQLGPLSRAASRAAGDSALVMEWRRPTNKKSLRH